MKIYVVSLGCAKNQVDTERMLGSLLGEGCEICAAPEEADLLLVNTCAFIQEARDEASAVIIELVSQKRADQKLVVTGCFVNYYGEKILKGRQMEVDAWLPVADEKLVAATVRKLFKKPFADIPYGPRIRITPPHYGFLRIADGCDHKCAFCSIPRLRGPMSEEPIDELVREAEEMAAEGVVELNVIAQDTSAYKKLPELLRRLCAIDDLYWIRLQYLYPATMSDELIETIAGEDKICKYIDLPLQHVNEDVLKAMRRPTHAFTEKLLEKIMSKIPDVTLRTTFITGFPGETEEDFVKTLEICSRAAFDAAFTFQYSIRPGTKAAEFPDQIPADVVTERFGRLTELTNSLTEQSCKRLVGRKEEILIEGISKAGGGVYSGRTISNHLVNFTIPDEIKAQPGFCEDALEGRLCNVDIQYARPYSVDGVMERFTDGK